MDKIFNRHCRIEIAVNNVSGPLSSSRDREGRTPSSTQRTVRAADQISPMGRAAVLDRRTLLRTNDRISFRCLRNSPRNRRT